MSCATQQQSLLHNRCSPYWPDSSGLACQSAFEESLQRNFKFCLSSSILCSVQMEQTLCGSSLPRGKIIFQMLHVLMAFTLKQGFGEVVSSQNTGNKRSPPKFDHLPLNCIPHIIEMPRHYGWMGVGFPIQLVTPPSLYVFLQRSLSLKEKSG